MTTLKISKNSKLKTIDLRQENIEKIKDKVHKMCSYAFSSNLGDAEDSDYDELDEMLWKLIDGGRW